MSLPPDIAAELHDLHRCDRLRSLTVLSGPTRLHPTTAAGHPLLSFASNDYLGLASHSALVEAATASLRVHGLGAGSSRLVAGHSSEHERLEHGLAAFLGTESALVFPTGYQTNLGVLGALAGPQDLIASDAANHASIIDACRLTSARVIVYRHATPEDAAAALATPGSFRRRILVTESLFSMDGDRAPLAHLAAVSVRAGAVFIVDEAHAIGAVGPGGRGLAAAAGVTPDVLVGTLGKAFGTLGGFAASSQTLRALFINRARQFIYTTASPPLLAAATSAALTLVSGPEGETRRRQLADNALRLRTSLATAGILVPGRDAILPILIGRDDRALELSAALRAHDIFVPAIRPPTVPEGTARLRITVAASHRPEEIDHLARALGANLPSDPLRPPP